jgi:Flp pilus assembly CpaE family ATPase
MALLLESRAIFLVTTPEVVSLHFAGVRFRQLHELGLKERVRLVVTRLPRNKSLPGGLAEIVGLPVAHTVVNDYAGVQNFSLEGSPAAFKGELRKSFLSLARSLSHQEKSGCEAPGRKFLEFFHLSKPQAPRQAW